MSEPTQRYISKNFSHRDFSGQDLRGCYFLDCTFDDTCFIGADLQGATLIKCHGYGVVFTTAKLRQVVFENCRFPFSDFTQADFTDSDIRGLDLHGSVLSGCRFNQSRIDDLNIRRCELGMASFLDSQIFSVDYIPHMAPRGMRHLHFFRKGHLYHNQIFINGNQHLQFSKFCRDEASKERLFTRVDNLPAFLHQIGYITLFLFGIVSDFGQSFMRWLLFVAGIVAVFACILYFQYGLTLSTSFGESLRIFFSLDVSPHDSLVYILESVTGYFMLGILIALLTNKIVSNG